MKHNQSRCADYACRQQILKDLEQCSLAARGLVKLVRQLGDGGKAELEVTIHEGRNRQVRRMCAMAGMDVKRLIRISESNVRLGNLQPGKWRYLTTEELAALH